MKVNRYTYIIITTILLFGFFSSYAQQGRLKEVYLPKNLEPCASQDFNSFELTIEWMPPMPAANNVYTVELSNAQGVFSNPDFLAEIKQKQFNSTPKFVYLLKLPKTVRGDAYRIRVRSSNPYSEKVTEPFPAYYISYKKRLNLNNGVSNVTLCPGDSKVLSISNSDLPKNDIVYKWFKNGVLIPGVSGASYEVSEAGVYQVEVDYGKGFCTRTANTKSNEVTVTVQGTTDLKLNGGITQKYICKGNGFELVASKKEPNIIYSWYREGNPDPVASGKGMYNYTTPKDNSAAGRYYVKIGDGSSGCQERSNILEVRIRQEFEVTTRIEDGNDVLLPGKEKKLVASTVGAENPTYQWYRNGLKIEGATRQEYITKLEGSYTVKVKESAGCEANKESNPPLKLVYPTSLQAEIEYKSYYEECETGRVVIGINNLKAVIGSRKEDIPQSSYADLEYKWKKDGIPVSGEANYDIILDNPTQNGTYKAYVSYGTKLSVETNSLPVKLVSSDNNVVLKAASYTPSDGGGVVHLCKGFKEKLEVEGHLPASSNFIWYKDDNRIVTATGSTYTATEEGNYRVEVSGGTACPVVTNNLSLQNINISVNFLNNFKYFTSSKEPVILFLPYKGIDLRTSIVGIDPGKIKISWYKNGSLIPSANSANYKVSDLGDYYCEVTPSLTCAKSRTSNEVKVVSPKTYRLKIDYKSGKEACNDAQEVVLELVSLKGIAQVGTEEIEIDIPEDDYPHYRFQWYKGNELLSGQTSTTLTVPAEKVGGASTISDYTLEMTYSGGTTVKSNSKQAGVEKLETTVVLNSSVGYSPQENEVFVCEGKEVVLKAEVRPNSSSNTYQWYKGFDPISGATSPTVSVTEEASYSVRVSGKICQDIPSKNTYNVRFFNRNQIKFYLRDTDEVLDLSKKITFVAGEPIQIRVEGAKNYLGLNENDIEEGIKTDGNIITIKKGGKFKIKADIGDENCAVYFDLEVEEIPLPSEVPNVVIPGSVNNRYWNLPSEYMQKENVKVSIYTQDGVEVLSTTNFRNDSWPTDFNVESTGRAVIYLYIIEVDGTVKERGTITLFQ